MIAKSNEELAEALQRQGRPLQALDAADKVNYIMTDQQVSALRLR